MTNDPPAKLPSHIHTGDFGGGRLYVKFRPSLVSLLDSEWTPEELLAIATDIAQRKVPVSRSHPDHTLAPEIKPASGKEANTVSPCPMPSRP